MVAQKFQQHYQPCGRHHRQRARTKGGHTCICSASCCRLHALLLACRTFFNAASPKLRATCEREAEDGGACCVAK